MTEVGGLTIMFFVMDGMLRKVSNYLNAHISNRYQMMFSRKEFSLATSIIIVKRRSGMTLEQEVKQLFAARSVKPKIRVNW